jgi:DNA polymerase-3 subunit alpha
MPEFIHLHNHSHYSLLDGAATTDALLNSAVEQKMPSLALTDHGVMFGAIEFYKKAHKAGVKPILGCEAYIVTKGSRFTKEAKGASDGQWRGIYDHIVLLAKNLNGYHNLIKLCTLAHTEGFYYKPRIDAELLRSYADGLVALSACAAGVVSRPIVNGKLDEAKEAALIYKEIFGDDFYIEIQNHGVERERIVREHAPKLAKELGIKLIGTNDIHYVKREHAIAHNVMLLIPDASATATTDYRQLRYQTDQIYFKSAAEMCALFKDYPEAIESTLEVNGKIDNYKIEPDAPFMPRFPIPADAGVDTLEAYLDRLAHHGLRRRYSVVTGEIENRLDHELSVIKRMGYAGYFLIVQDFINAARARGVYVGAGRGSAAGSLVSYALGITNVDPLKYDLLFERFLNPDRVSMPDIDIDFADNKRDQVIQYVKDKYGEDAVAQIITFSTLSARAVLKDVGRVLGVPLGTIDSITKQIPVIQGKVTPLAEVLKTNTELKWVKDSDDPKIRELIDISLVLEGMNRGASMHAAGVVIAPGPLADYVPIYKTPHTELMTQYNMKDLEDVGLLKMDLLGLRTLTVLENALTLIERIHGVRVDLDSIPENDPRTFELFGAGQTVGIFQFESSGMQESLRKLKPNSISDLVAMNALYRPGPMEMIDDFIRRKHGQQRIAYLHPKLEPILNETYGIIVYQEQVMKIASEIAGFSLAKADIMRRAMGKKDKALMAKQKQEFFDGAAARGFARNVASEIFDMIEKFASYGFNKSHSVAYSIIAYQTAFLKAHYPSEFLAAAMSAEFGDTDYVALLIEDARRLGIGVLPPDVNESDVDFTVVSNEIRFGMSAIKNVGVSAVESVIKARLDGGRFKNLFDFCTRVDLRLVNKKTIESLVQAGAFDSLGGHRAQLFEAVERAIQFGQSAQGHASRGQSTLFEMSPVLNTIEHFPQLPEQDPWGEAEKLSREKKVLGFYISGHPLKKYELEVQAFSTARFGEGESVKNGSPVRVCGIISAVKKKIDKKGNPMAFISIEDFTGRGEAIVFSKTFEKFSHHIQPEAMVMVIGKADASGDSFKVLVDEVYPMDEVRQKFTRSIVLSVNVNEIRDNAIVALRSVMEKHKGNCRCYLDVVEPDKAKPSRFHTMKFAVNASDQFLDEVRKILGPNSVRISQNG